MQQSEGTQNTGEQFFDYAEVHDIIFIILKLTKTTVTKTTRELENARPLKILIFGRPLGIYRAVPHR